MPKTELELWYDFALLQIAADSHLDGIDRDDAELVIRRLKLGNNDLRPDVYVNGVLQTNQFAGRYPEEENSAVLPGATRLTASQASYLFDNWRIVDHHANDASGFSATLLQDRSTGEYTLSFRSTEFRSQTEGGDRERDVLGADGEIGLEGFAYAQLSAMERYYRELSGPGGPLEGKQFNVTGYSLGGHLATVFTELHWSSVSHTYLFNAAGRGSLTGGIASIGQVIEAYDALVLDPEAAFTRGLIPATDRYRFVGPGAVTDRFEKALVASDVASDPRQNAYLNDRHLWAVYVLDAFTRGALGSSILSAGGISPLATQKITYVYGMGSHGDETVVTNSGLTPGRFEDKYRVFIEDQPDRYGDLSDASNGTVIRDGDFGRTHSISLIVDSLAAINLFRKADPSLSQQAVETILAASSNQRASVVSSSYLGAGVEGNSLENALNALARILLGPEATPLTYDSTPDGFGNLDNREAFYNRIQELETSIQSHVVPSLKIIPFGTMEWQEVFKFATIKSFNTVPGQIDPELLYTFATNRDDPEAVAYRYALRELNPFVLFGGVDHYLPFNQQGELDLFDPETGKGLTEEYLRARARMLAETFERNVNDKGYAAGEPGENVLFDDRTTNVAVPVFENPLGIESALQPRLAGLTNDARDGVFADVARMGVKEGATKLIGFGRDVDEDGQGIPDEIIGGGAEDQLFGLGGDDILEGKDKNDYLEGGAGEDLLIGGAGDDVLFGLDHEGGDRLRGGEGYDTYYADWGDIIRDGAADGETRSGIIYVTADELQLTGGRRKEGESFFTSSDGKFVYWESGAGEILVYDARGGDTPLRIEAPTAAVAGHETITLGDGTTAEVSGRPDLGIQLMTIKDPRPRVEPIPSRLSVLFNQARNWRERADPLALDLGASGIHAIGDIGDATVLFDMDGNGVRNGTGWLTGEDGWVVLDRDGDGLITTGAELFGVDTLLPNGQKAPDGFAALAPLDTNNDGKVDAADAPLAAWQVVRDVDDDGFVTSGEQRAAGFADLQIWRDANVNGISEPFELETLAEAGVQSISLGKYLWGQPIGGDNRALYGGTFTRTDGSLGNAYALDLARETFYREYATPPAYDPSIAALPAMRGSGRVRDLQEAAAASPEFRALLAQVAAMPTRAEQWAAIDQVLQTWVATSDMPDGVGAAAARANAPVLRYYFPTGRPGPADDITGGPVGEAYLAASGGDAIAPAALPPGWYEAQQSTEYRARLAKLSVIERFMGQTWAQVPQLTSQLAYTANFPGPLPTDPQTEVKVYAIDTGMSDSQWYLLDLAYTGLKEAVYGAIAAQTRLAPYLEAATVAAGTRDFSPLEAMLAAKRAANPGEWLSDVVELGRYLGVELVERGWHTLPFLIDQSVREAIAEPTLAPLLADLRVKVRDNQFLSGTVLGDTLIGSAWWPDYWTLAGTNVSGDDGNDVILGGVNDSYIYGNAGRDLIYSGAASGVMYGGPGRDVFVFGRGSGRDEIGPDYTQLGANGYWTIPPGDRDILALLPGVAPEDVLVRRSLFFHNPGVSFPGLSLSIIGTNDLFIDSQFFSYGAEPSAGRSIAEVRFADGTIWDYATLRLKAIEGTDGNDGYYNGIVGLLGYDDSDDVIDGRAGDDVIEGGAGDDTLIGGAGNDTISGGDGADDLNGGEGDDTLTAGTGVDRLDGGPGNDKLGTGGGVDVIVFGRNSGRDTIYDNINDWYAYSYGLTTADMDVVELAPDVAPGDVRALHAIEALYATTALHISIAGTSAELIDLNFKQLPVGVTSGRFAGEYATIRELRFADGTVWDREFLQRKSMFGTDAAETIMGFDELANVMDGGGGDDVLYGKENADVIDGGAGRDQLVGAGGGDVLRGGAGDDSLDGGPGDDRYEGGPGIDTLIAGAGRDTYLWRRGDGGERILLVQAGLSLAEDTIEIGPGLGLDGLVAYRQGPEYNPTLVIGDPATDEWLSVPDLPASQLPALAFASPADAWTWEMVLARLETPTEGADLLRYTAFDDMVSALGGDDVIEAGGGNDYVYAGEGNNTLRGGAGNDQLYAGNGADTFDGGPGDDSLGGSAGSDLYLFQGSFGRDELQELPDPGTDVVRFVDVASTGVRITRESDWWGTRDVLTVTATGDRVEILFGGTAEIERFEFADGVSARPVRAVGSLPTNLRARENEAFAFVLPAGAFADADGLDTLTYTAALEGGGTLPGGLAFDPATRRISGTPTGVTPGPANFVFTATDPLGFSARQTLSVLLLGPNTVPTAQPIANQAVLEDGALNFYLPSDAFADADPYDQLVYAARRADGGALPAWLRFDSYSRQFYGIPRNADVGSVDVRVTATDYSDASTSTTFAFTVVNTNDAPAVVGVTPAQVAQAGVLFDVAGPRFQDVDVGDVVALSARLAGGAPLPAWLAYDPGTGRFAGTPTVADVGRFTVETVATDLAGAQTVSSFTLRVSATDGTWRAEDDVATVAEDTPLVLDPETLLANDRGGDPFLPLTIVAVGNAVNGTVATGAGGQIVFTPAADFNGTGSFEYTAEDDVGGRAAARVAVTVTPVNDAPRPGTPIPVQTAFEDQPFSFTVPGTALVDPDPGAILTYAATLSDGSALPAWLGFTPSSRSFSGYPTYLNGAPLSIRLTATDQSGAKGSTDFTLNVVLTSIVGTSGDDLLTGTAAANRLYGFAGADRLDGGAGADQMYGGPGDDLYIVDNTGDFVSELAGEGRDRVESSVSYTLPANVEDLALTGTGAINGTGNTLDNTLSGNSGANQLSGSTGNDVYLYGRGGGADTINEFDQTAGNVDRVRLLPGIAPGDVTLQRIDNQLILRFPGTGDRLTFANWFVGAAYQVERVEFDDGTVWDAAKLATAPRSGQPGVNDAIYGTSGPGTADYYLFGRGFGQDTIWENYSAYADGGFDTLIFEPDVAPGDIALRRIDSNLLLSIRGTNDRLTFGNWFADPKYQVEQARFADGTGWDAATLARAPRYGEPNFNDTIYVSSPSGDDYYLFGRGFGQDTVYENYGNYPGGGQDALVFEADVAPGDVVLRRTDTNLVLSIRGTNDRLTFGNWFSDPKFQVERVEFADGTVWDTSTLARALRYGEPNFNDTIYVASPSGDDYYLFGRGFGQDTIYENYGNYAGGGLDTLIFEVDVAPADVVLKHVDANLVLSIRGTTDRLTFARWFDDPKYQVERVEFGDGTVWDAATLAKTPRYGDPGVNDTIYVSTPSGDDYYLFGRGFGQDTIYENYSGYAGAGFDTLVFEPDVAPGDVTLRHIDSNLVFSIRGTTDSLTFGRWFEDPKYQVERVEFGDGTVWDSATLARAPRYGAPGVNDTIFVTTSSADDYYLFGRGFGQDTVYENYSGYLGGGFDTLVFEADVAPGDVVLKRVDSNLILSIRGASDRLTFGRWFEDPKYQVERVEFGDGTVWDAATLAKAPRSGDPGVNDTIFVTTPSADDYYLFGRGFGQDTIWENYSGYVGGGTDTVLVEPDLRTRDLALSRAGGDLVLSIVGAADSLTLKNWFVDPRYRVERVEFADGRAWDGYYLENLGVVPNRPPVLDAPLADQAATEDAAFAFKVPAASFRDPDPWNLLDYSARRSGGGALPGWLAFDPATRTFSGTPENADVGAIDVEVVATDDSGAQIADVFTVTVANTNDAPVANGVLPRQRADEDAPFSYSLPAGLFTDEDAGDTLTLSAGLAGGAPLPAWLSFDPVAGRFSGTPANADVQDLTVEIVANDVAGTNVATLLGIEVANTPDAPVLAEAIADQGATEDAAFAFTVPATTFADVDAGDALTYSASQADGSPLPAWLSFDAATRTFSGTPVNEDVGAVALAVRATDTTGLSAVADFTLTVANTPDAPVLAAPIAHQSAAEDAPFSFTVPATTFADVDAGDVLTYSALQADGSPLPGWLAFDPTTRTFSGTPANEDVGSLSIRLTATDATGLHADALIALAVANTPDAPVLAEAVADQAATEDAPFSLAVPATTFADVDAGDVLTYSASRADGSPLPAWLAFDAATRTFSGTPANEDVGSVSIRLTATDATGLQADTLIALAVANTPDAPVLAGPIADQAATEDAAFSFTLPATTFADVDAGDVLTYSALQADGSPLPGWLAFDSATRTFSGTPANEDVGAVDVEVTATDATLRRASDVFTLSVANTNDAPALAEAIADQSATEDAPFSFTVPATTFTDVDAGDALTYSASQADGSPLPAWLAFDGATRTFSGTPANEDVGAVALAVTATDAAGSSASANLTLSVANTPDAPVLAEAIADQAAVEDAPFSFTVPAATFADVDAGDALTYTASRADGSPLPAWLAFDAATRTFSGTPANEDVGSVSIRLTATDATGLQADTLVALAVANTPDAPVLAEPIDDQAATEDAAFTFTLPAATFADVDAGDVLTYSASRAGGAPLPGWLSFDPVTRTFSGTPANEDVGAVAVVVTATDTTGLSALANLTLSVANTPDAPGLAEAIADQSTAEDAPFSFTVPAASFADVDAGDMLTYAASRADGSPLPAWLAFDTVTRTFTGTPANEDVGAVALVVTATDTTGLSAAANLTLTVVNTPDAPVVAAPIADQAATEDAPFSFTLPAATFADVDAGDALTYAATRADGSPLPGWLAFDPATRAFSGTPANEDVGAIDVEVTATDATLRRASDVFTLAVANTNDAPMLAEAIADQSVAAGEALGFTVPATAFSDPDTGDLLAYTAALAGGGALPAWLAFDGATRTFSGAPTNADVGAIDVEVTATDLSGASAAGTFRVSVAHTNTPPVATGELTPQTARDGAPFVYALPAGFFADADADDTLTLSARRAGGASLPTWLGFDPATGIFGGTPDDGDVGGLAIEISATDTSGATASAILDLQVVDTPEAPVLVQPPALQTANEDEPWFLDVPSDAFADPDAGDVLTYAASRADGSALPAWLAFDGVARRLYGTPANADVGTVELRVTATDTAGSSAAADLTLTVVNTPDAPELAEPLADQSATEDAPFSFTIPARAFVDPDAGDTLLYAAQAAGGGALPAWLAFDAATRTFSGTPANADVGAVDIEVTVADASGALASDVFTLSVGNTNDAPVVNGTLPRQRADEDAPFTYALPGDLFSDEDPGDALTFAARLASGAALPDWLVFDPAAGLFSGTPTDADLGNLAVEVVATDTDGASAAATLEIEVVNTPDPPVLVQEPAAQTALEDEPWELVVPSDAFVDPDAGDALTYSAAQADGSALPAWLEFDPAFVRFRGTPANGDVGTVALAVTATDTTGLSAAAILALTVENAPDAPVLAGEIPDQAAVEEEWFTYTGSPDQFADDDLVHGDALALTASLAGGDALPAWLSFDPWSFAFTGMPGRGDAGVLAIEVTATDTTLRAVTDSFTLTIAPAAPVPVLPGDDWAWMSEDGVLEIPAADLVGNDGPEPWLLGVVAVSNAEHGTVSLDEGGLVTFRPEPEFSGAASFEYTVANGQGGAGTATVRVDVAPVNDAPTFVGGLPDIAAVVREPLALTLPGDAFADRDGDALWYWLEGDVPPWLQLDTSTLTLSGVPDDVGTYRLVLTAMDPYGETARGEFELAVAPGGPIVGTPFGDYLYGTSIADTLIGLDGADWLDGRAGADEMRGGPGDDTYSVDDAGDLVVEAPGEGHDTVYSYLTDYVLPAGVEDVFFFVGEPVHGIGNDRGNWLYGGSGADLLEGLEGADHLYGDAGDDELRGGAGRDSVEDWLGDDLLLGGDGDDTLSSGEGADVLDGGAGRDWLSGGPGSDVYLFARGSDRDELYEWDAANVNVIRVADDLAPADLIVRSPWSWTLSIGIRDTNDVFAIGLWPFGSVAQAPFVVEFADGTVWDAATLAALAAAGVAEDLVRYGTEEADDLGGGPGGDQLYGAGGDDALSGGGGDDWLYGEAGDDVIEGGPGDDSMVGGEGSDTYRFGRGSGRDYLYDSGWDAAETDTLVLGAGVAPRDVVLRGDSWNRTLEILGTSDRLMFDVTLERIAFADGTVWNAADIALRLVWDQGAYPLLGTAGADLLDGTYDGDELHGFEGDDVLDPGDGPWWSAQDTLIGGEGNDAYVFRPGVGQDMILDLAGDLDRIEVRGFLPADLRVARRGIDDLRLVADATGDSFILRGFFADESARIEEVRFADGTVWHAAEMAGWGNEPTEADDVLVGTAAADFFDGRGGHDEIQGLGGDDVLFGGAGYDALWGGDGADLLDGGADDDTLLGGPGDDLLRGGAGADQVLDYDGGADVLEGGEGNDGLNVSAGRALLAGGAGDDQLYLWTGEAGVLAGGAGDDQLVFGADALLLVNRGDGSDSAYAYVYGAPRASVSLGGGIAYEDLALEEAAGSLVVHLGNGERLVLDGWYADPARQVVEEIQFIAEAMAGYDPGGADPLRDQKIERFDFKALVAAFDEVRGAQVAAQWSAMDALLAAHLGGSDTEALGGDLAYRYGLAGGFGDIGKSAAQAIIAEPGFAAAPQALKPLEELAADPVKLGG